MVNINSPEMMKKAQEIQNFFKLECSIHNLTKKCFKICLNYPKSQQNDFSYKREVFYLDQSHQDYQQIEKRLLDCIYHCSDNYVRYRKYVKDKFMFDYEQVMDQNQEIFEDFYQDKKQEI